LALKLWMKELQYSIDEEVLADFVPPKKASILLMLEPLSINESEMQAIDDWVETGGTLIAIGDQYSRALMDHYQFTFSYLLDPNGMPDHATPLFSSPSTMDIENTEVKLALRSERDDFVVLVAQEGEPVVVSFEQGKGRVILGTTVESFTNAGLKKASNPELVLNLLALAPPEGIVWFDEWHHGVRSGQQVLGPADFLRRTPIGRSLLFVVFAVFIAMLVQGRGFGRPVPLPQEIKRRGALEHVTGIANLSRRAAHRPAVMLHYHQQVKRKLGQRYRLDPSMDDQEYVNALASYNAELNKDELLSLLRRLKRKDVSEAEMVSLATEASKWINN
jgi:hypothetical protein